MLGVPTSPGSERELPVFFHDLAPNAFDLMKGIEIRKFDDPLVIEFATRAAYAHGLSWDYIRSGAPFPIVSANLRKLLVEVAPECVQFFDAKILGPKGLRSTETHFAVNICITHSVIDLAKSDPQGIWNSASPPEFVIWGFRSIVLKEELDTAPPIFREPITSSLVICNDELQRLCRQRNFKIEFTPVVEWVL